MLHAKPGPGLRARALARQGRPEEASTAATAALGYAADSSATQAQAGWVALETNRPKEALHHFREALRLNPDSDFAREGLVEALKARYWVYRTFMRFVYWSGSLSDVDDAWTRADADEQADVRRLTAELGAEVALAAGIGELELHRGAPTYALWKHFLEGGSRLDEWRARLAAAPDARAKARLLTAALWVNRDHLRMELGRPPTRQEVRTRQARRVRQVFGEITRRSGRA